MMARLLAGPLACCIIPILTVWVYPSSALHTYNKYKKKGDERKQKQKNKGLSGVPHCIQTRSPRPPPAHTPPYHTASIPVHARRTKPRAVFEITSRLQARAHGTRARFLKTRAPPDKTATISTCQLRHSYSHRYHSHSRLHFTPGRRYPASPASGAPQNTTAQCKT